MVSRWRMKVDLLGQIVLAIALLLLVFYTTGIKWTHTMLILLAFWQLGSAIHLFYVYSHIRRIRYLRTALVIGISLPIWYHLIGNASFFSIAGLVMWYFIQTIRDTIIVYRRPRSFWDLT